MWCT